MKHQGDWQSDRLFYHCAHCECHSKIKAIKCHDLFEFTEAEWFLFHLQNRVTGINGRELFGGRPW